MILDRCPTKHGSRADGHLSKIIKRLIDTTVAKYHLCINNRRQNDLKEFIMGRKALTKKQKVLNLLSTGKPVTWKTLRNRFDLTSPRAMVDTLREEGHMVYVNQTSNGTSYRLGTPTKAILAAGVRKVFKGNTLDIVSAGIRALYGKQKYAYKYSAV